MSHNQGRIRVLHIITGLHTGGAEMMLLKLLREFDASRYEHYVISILGEGELSDDVAAVSKSVISLDIKSPVLFPIRLMKALNKSRKLGPNIIQGWMYHGNFFATIFRQLISQSAVVLWNLRCSEPAKAGFVTEKIRSYCLQHSSKPDYVICNSYEGMDYHKSIGYRPRESGVIGNGIDVVKFSPSSQKRRDFRRELGIDEGAIVIGIAASLREMKDYRTFFSAVEIMAKSHKNLVFVAAGRGISTDNPEVLSMAKRAVSVADVRLLGEVSNMPGYMNALDVFTLSSKMGEGFPNVIGEAMATGTVCVVTDVGDSKLLVAQRGIVVNKQSPVELAAAWGEILTKSPEDLQELALLSRAHIVDNYQISSITKQYQDLYESLLLQYASAGSR